jgi:hypothetical protein
VASNVLLALGVSQQDLIIPPKEDVIEGEGFEVDMQDFEDENK